ncbi:MAG: alanine racemase [Candidatus Izemoplasmataceae bacterium]
MNYRPTKAIINLNHIYDNYIHATSTSNKKIIPVVKADAYGHGLKEVVSFLIKKGINYFAVSLIEEALEIRALNKEVDILVMGVVDEFMFKVLSDQHLTFTIHTYKIKDALVKSDLNLKCHIKFDSGMHRLGLTKTDEVYDLMQALKHKDNINIEGIYTHFATADSDITYYQKQLRLFQSLIHNLPYDVKMIHASNSSSTLKYEHAITETTHSRLGISLYGLSLDEDQSHLKPAFKLITQVVEIKALKKNDYLGYGITYQAFEDEIIAILPLGYADGLIRKNQGGYVEINGNKYEIVGRVCMDQTFVKIDANVNIGDEVIIMGSNLITIDDVAKRLGTINYEIVCLISKRVPRIYIK